MLNYLSRLDRRIIFLLVALAILFPMVSPLKIPILKSSRPVKSVYDKIESMPSGSVLMLAFDFTPGSAPELMPMANAILRHAFQKGIRIISLSLDVTGVGMAEKIITKISDEYDKRSGYDWVLLGWKPGYYVVIINLGQDIYRAFPEDHYGKRTRDLPVMAGIKDLKDIDYVIDLASSNTPEMWIQYGQTVHRFDMAVGCTGVIVPGIYPYYQAGQLNGIISGLKGAAEYEMLLKRRDFASMSMDSLSLAHFTLIFLIVAGNILYILSRRRRA